MLPVRKSRCSADRIRNPGADSRKRSDTCHLASRLRDRQANELGGHIRKGEESTAIVFWKIEDAKRNAEDLDAEETEKKTRRQFLLRFYRVWNLEQCELPQAVLDKLPKIETHEHDPIEAAERLIAAMPDRPEIQHAGPKAFYSPITDRITLPPRELFASGEEYYATALHETVHSTGSPRG